MIPMAVIVRPQSEIDNWQLAQHFSSHFRRLEYEARYPIRAIYDEVKFDKDDHVIRTRLRIIYDGGVTYGLRCSILPTMVTKCAVIIFGISFETLAGSTFEYEWSNNKWQESK